MLKLFLAGAALLGFVNKVSGQTCTNGASIAIDGGSSCICDSGRVSGDCGTLGACVSSADPNQPQLTVDTNLTVIQPWVDDADYSLVVTMTGGAKRNRRFTSFAFKNCASSRFMALSTITNASNVADAANCKDDIQMKIDVNLLEAGCGFTVGPAFDEGGVWYRFYNGSLDVTYTEPVTLGSVNEASDTRTVSTTLPVNFKLQVLFNATVTTDINVTSKFNITAAVTQQIVLRPDQAQSTLNLTYAIHWPYDVSQYKTVLTPAAGASVSAANAVSVTGPSATSGANTLADRCRNGTANDYLYPGGQGICRKTMQITFLHAVSDTPRVCELDGIYTLENVVVTCSPDIAAEDCPLQTPDTGTTIAMTLNSDNFCQTGGALYSINNIIKVIRFIAPTGTTDALRKASTTHQRAWEWNRPTYFRIDLQGPRVSSVLLQKWEVSTDGGAWADKTTNNGLAVNGTLSTTFQQDVTGSTVGLRDDVPTGSPQVTQTYWLQQVMTSEVLPDPGPGLITRLSFRCTFEVYYDAQARRRRAVVVSETENKVYRRATESGSATVRTSGSVYGQAASGGDASTQLTGTSAASKSVVASPVVAFVAFVAMLMQ